MRLAGDPDALRWLLSIRDPASELDWDAGNLRKSRKHGVESHEIEAIIRGDFYCAGRIVEPSHSEPRWLVLGENDTGRRLALVLTRRGDKLRPICCRPMRRKERALYEQAAQAENGTPSG